MRERESDIELALVRACNAHGALCLKWTCPGHAGVPDRIVLMPGGRVSFVELKAPGKKLRPLQECMVESLQRLGHFCYVIDSLHGVKDFVELNFTTMSTGDLI